MPRKYDDDRPKKSWRELDRNKDKSSHRKEDRPAMPRHKQARSDSASKAYKSQLNSFFDGDGKAPAHVKEKLASLEPIGGKKRAEALKAIHEAPSSSAKTKAIAAFLEKWELPPDYEVLTDVLACSDDDYIAMAMDLIDELFAANRVPKRAKSLEQRLRSIVSLNEEPSLQERAQGLIKKLRLFT